jgi:hypothetical protein
MKTGAELTGAGRQLRQQIQKVTAGLRHETGFDAAWHFARGG